MARPIFVGEMDWLHCIDVVRLVGIKHEINCVMNQPSAMDFLLLQLEKPLQQLVEQELVLTQTLADQTSYWYRVILDSRVYRIIFHIISFFFLPFLCILLQIYSVGISSELFRLATRSVMKKYGRQLWLNIYFMQETIIISELEMTRKEFGYCIHFKKKFKSGSNDQ